MQINCSECGAKIEVDLNDVVYDSSGAYIECPDCHIDIDLTDSMAAIRAKSIEWEYKVVQIDDIFKPGVGKIIHGDINSFDINKIERSMITEGQRGWELVEVVPTIGAFGTASKLLLFYKRLVA